jgi:ankyrin repeat protein
MGEPLLYALNTQHRPEMMLLLLSFGASPNVDSTRGISLGYSLYVRDGRAAEEQRALLEIMLRHGLDPNRDARLVLHLLDDEKIVDLRMMLEHGLRPDLIYNGKTLLDIAASHGQTEVVKTLKAALE